MSTFVSLEGLEALSIDEARVVNDREAPMMFGPVEEVASAVDRSVGGVSVRTYQPLGKVRMYLGGASGDDPDASPMTGNLGGVAPALILSCGLDDLKPQSDAYAARLEEAGVAVRHIVYPDLIHNAYRMPGVLPGARRMLEDSAEALAAAFR